MMRRYGGAQQRFSQPDPYDGSYEMADPQSLNRYSYVGNDPVNKVDPSGLDGDLASLYAVFGSHVADLPGFGTNWGSFGELGIIMYEERLDNWRGGFGFRTNEQIRQESQQNTQDHTYPGRGNPEKGNGTTCPPVRFKVTGIGPGQAPGTTAISQTPRADIPNGGVAIKPGNFGVSGINSGNRDVFLGIRFTVDWSTASPVSVPSGIPTQGPFYPVDNIGPRSVRLAPGNMIDVYNYSSMQDARSSTRTVMVTTYIPANTVGVTCPKGN
jgi:hypothetical protein